MRQTLWTLATLLSHWRRRPANLGALLVGLAIATALWSGVQALNQQARRSYDRAAGLFGVGSSRSLVSTRGALFSQDLYIGLRRAGWKVSPVLEGTIRIGDEPFRLIGVEPLTLPRESPLSRIRDEEGIEDFLRSPGRTLLSPQTRLDVEKARAAAPAAGDALPPFAAWDDLPPGLLVVDIGVAQGLLMRPERLSRLIVSAPPRASAPQFETITGGELRLVEPEEEPELAKLTDSFHLNLTAFGMLAYVVGLFIVHASFGLAFEQRLSMVRTMRAVGVSARALAVAMLCELSALALIAGSAGMIGGYLIAAALLPNVSASLDGLYGAQVEGRLSLDLVWWASGLGMAALGALVAAAGGLFKTFRLPVLAVAQPFAWREAQQSYLRRQGVFAGAGFAVSLAAFFYGEGLYAGFVSMAGLLLGAALLLPLLLAAALRVGERRAAGAVAKWFWADSRQQLPGLSLALMALLLALAANIGVGAMVAGFRETFTQWLDRRLVAEVYLEAAGDADARRIEAWLEKRPDVAAVLPAWRAKTRLSGWPVDVVGSRAHETFRGHFPLLSATEDAWDRVERGDGALVSEQLARRLDLAIGAKAEIPTPTGSWRAEIVGVYPDYGNPKGQLRIGLDALTARWPDAQRTNYSLRTRPEAASGLILALQEEFGPAIARILDQAGLKERSTHIFERTFAVTAALDTLTLIVSAVALFASLSTLAGARIAQLAPVWAMGVDRRRLSQLEFLRILLFSAPTAIVAVPLGLALAWHLVAVVNVRAFGWRLPLYLFPGQWAEVFALALLTAAVASLAPILRLARTAPAALLAVFANER
ncbi:MAG: ABC transporter permease [Methylocystaceae bacterium]|nr:MAG: ABC transporter permease [Methylocystaceae bacterium]